MEGLENEVVIGLGANCGRRREAVGAALEWLSDILVDFVCSDIYETPAYGHPGAPEYMNAVAKGIFRGETIALERMCKQYEADHGRDEEARRKSLVPIDIDIVFSCGNLLRPEDFRRSFFRIGYDDVMAQYREARM